MFHTEVLNSTVKASGLNPKKATAQSWEPERNKSEYRKPEIDNTELKKLELIIREAYIKHCVPRTPGGSN